ncbi:hypothetical protein ACHAXA_000774 [Cyclostephanos tholiformis]|uniref:Uncharacterized protein n=1 Tax=Cyclostephanos tholiformis TaxID=382380 RepID=A0ABD3REM6_9STRA
MNQFVQRVAHYIANELLVKGLAESKAFQRIVVHTDRHIQKYKKEGLEQVNTHIDELHKKATQAAYSTSTKNFASSSSSSPLREGKSGSELEPPQRPLEGIPGFFRALEKVIRRDLGIGVEKK